MSKEGNAGKSILAAGAATAVAGITLYAVGMVLTFLFRDVDPERIERAQEKPEDVIDTEPVEDAPAE